MKTKSKKLLWLLPLVLLAALWFIAIPVFAVNPLGADGYTGTYDGTGYGITVTGTQAGDVVTYSLDTASTKEYYLTESPKFYIGTHTVYYQVLRNGAVVKTGSATVSIAPKELDADLDNNFSTPIRRQYSQYSTYAPVNLVDDVSWKSGIVSGDENSVKINISGYFQSDTVDTDKSVNIYYSLTGPRANCYSINSNPNALISETHQYAIRTYGHGEIYGEEYDPDEEYESSSTPGETGVSSDPDTVAFLDNTVTYDGEGHCINVDSDLFEGTDDGDYTVMFSFDEPTDKQDPDEYPLTESEVEDALINCTDHDAEDGAKVYALATVHGGGSKVIKYITGSATVTIEPLQLEIAGPGFVDDDDEVEYADLDSGNGFPTARLTPGVLLNDVDGDDIEVSILSATFGSSDVEPSYDSKTLTVSYSISGDDMDNYTAPDDDEVDAYITGEDIPDDDIVIEEYDATYDGEEHDFTISGENADDYTVKFDGYGNGWYNDDPDELDFCEVDDSKTWYYKITREGYYPKYGSVEATISPREVDLDNTASVEVDTREFDDSTKVYKDDVDDSALSLTNTIIGDDVYPSLIADDSYYDAANAGPDNTAHLVYELDGDEADNYTFTGDEDTQEIEVAAEITDCTDNLETVYGDIELEGYDDTYDGEEHGITLTNNGDPLASVEYSYTECGEEAWTEFDDVEPTFLIGEYEVMVRVKRDNYEAFTFDAVDVEISPVELEAEVTVVSKAWDGDDSAEDDEISYIVTGWIDDDEDSVTVTASGQYDTADVGTEKEVEVIFEVDGTLHGLDVSAFYEAPDTEYFYEGVITGEDITDALFKVEGFSGTYDGDEHTYTASGTKLDDFTLSFSNNMGDTYTLADDDDSLVITDVADSATLYYQIDGTAYGYNLKTGTVDLTVTPMVVSLTKTGLTVNDREYDGTTNMYDEDVVYDQMALSAYAGTDDSDDVYPVLSEADSYYDNAGIGNDIDTTLNFALGGDKAGNYTFNKGKTLAKFEGKANIVQCTSADKLAVAYSDIRLTDYTGTFDGEAHGITVTKTADTETTYKYSYAAWDEEEGAYSDDYTDFSDSEPQFKIGKYDVKVKAERYGYDAYELTETAAIDIAPIQLTVTGTTVSKTFDGETAADDTQVTVDDTKVVGRLAADAANVTVSATGTFADENVGTGKSVDVTYTVSGTVYETGDAGTYYRAPVDETLTDGVITGKDPYTDEDFTVTVSAYSDTYDGEEHSVTLNNTVNTDKVYYSTDTVNTDPEDKTYGDANTPATFTDVTATEGETVYVRVDRVGYESWYGSATVKITPLKLTVTKNSTVVTKSKPYDETTTATITAIGTLSNAVVNDDVELDAENSAASYDTAAIGKNKTITVVYQITGEDADNYTAPDNATFTDGVITARPIPEGDVEVENYKGDYDAAEHTVEVATAEGYTVLYSADEGKTFTLTEAPTYRTGTHTVYLQASRETYADTVYTGTVTVDPIQLSVNGTTLPETKQFNGSKLVRVNVGQVIGILPGDEANVTVVAVGATAKASDLGEDIPVTVSYRVTGTYAEGYLAPAAEEGYSIDIVTRPCCTEQVAELRSGEYGLLLGDVNAGTYTLQKSANGYYVYDEAKGQYVGFDTSKKAVIYQAEPYDWRYADGLYTVVSTVTTTNSYWWWNQTGTTVSNYYLSAKAEGELTVSRTPVTAQITYTQSHTAHSFTHTYKDGDEHTVTCTVCGYTFDEQHTYDNTGKCFCGAVESGVYAVKSVKVTKSTGYGYGCGYYWGWGYKRTTYNITVESPDVAIAKVEYSVNGTNWFVGYSFDMDTDGDTRYIRVTDVNGNETYWKYANGAVTRMAPQ